MIHLLSAQELCYSYGHRSLFNSISFSIGSGERLGLLGPNGAGKSTLLCLLAGHLEPDGGLVVKTKGLRMGYLEQIPVFTPQTTLLSTLLEGCKDPLDHQNIKRAYELLSKCELDGRFLENSTITPETCVDQLSGGWKKRVAIARELMRQPDLMLLDEPTNHLDVEGVLWLENLIAQSSWASLTITHDRSFLQNVSTRILELDKRNEKGLLSVSGNYQDYLQIKEALMQAQEKEELILKNTLRREIEWLRSGTKARTTKQHARIERAALLAEEVEVLKERNQSRGVSFEFVSQDQKPKKLLEAKNISKTYGSLLFKDLNLLLSPGTRLGILGRNGCGKSTLIKVLLGQLLPDSGEVVRSDKLKVALFEQNRDALNLEITPIKILAPHGDQVFYRGRPLHIRGYLDRFLFTPSQMMAPAKQLSGGEQSRLLLARLMLQEANLLVLDEPTNDLDLATLGVLEDCLDDFDGAVLLVTHDRSFMDHVATQILAFDSTQAGHTSFFATTSQWQSWYQKRQKNNQASLSEIKKITDSSKPFKGASKVKMTFKEVHELAKIGEVIEQKEAELKNLMGLIEQPTTYQNSQELTRLTHQMASLENEINVLYERWAVLEKKQTESLS